MKNVYDEWERERQEGLTSVERELEQEERPKPVVMYSNVSHGLCFFLTEEDAEAFAEGVTGTYNGGYMHGAPCGREPLRDFVPEEGEYAGQKLYAVTTP